MLKGDVKHKIIIILEIVKLDPDHLTGPHKDFIAHLQNLLQYLLVMSLMIDYNRSSVTFASYD